MRFLKRLAPYLVALLILIGSYGAPLSLFAQSQRLQGQRLVAVPVLEEKIRKLQSVVLKNPSDLQSRLALAHALDSLGDYYERRRDNLSAWRYFQSAAKVMSESQDKVLQAQSLSLAARAEHNHQERILHLQKIHRLGVVAVKLAGQNSNAATTKLIAVYTAELQEKLHNAWDQVERARGVSKGERLPHSAIVTFRVTAAGDIVSTKVLVSSGDPVADQASLQALSKLGKLPALPAQLNKSAAFEAEFW